MKYAQTKRLIDLVASTGALWVSMPVIVSAGLAVKLTSQGPVFYRSERVGKDGKRFYLLKLRSMTAASAGDLQVTSGNDARITAIGKLLRKTKIDELPQLLNVLKGDVSLVGPRPEAPVYVAKYPEKYKKILSVKPGLTDRATLKFVDEEERLEVVDDPEKFYIETIMPEKMAMYLEYVDNYNLTEDLTIIYQTITHVLRRTLKTVAGKIK